MRENFSGKHKNVILSLSLTSHICGRWLGIHQGKIWNFYEWQYNYLIQLKTLWQKEKLLICFQNVSAIDALKCVCIWERVNGATCTNQYPSFNPFPHTTNLKDQSLNKSWKHCGKRRNCLLWAISPFAIMFSKDVRCRCITSGKVYLICYFLVFHAL